MAEQAIADGIGGELGAGSELEARGGGRGCTSKSPLLFIVLLNLLVGGAGAGAYWMVVRDAAPAREAHGRDEGTSPAVRAARVTFDVPEMLVTLTGADGQASRLRISFTLEVADQATIEQLRTVMPLVIDNFQVYLRQLAVEDLNGLAGTARLREDLLLRVNAAIRPAEVQDVRVKEMEIR